MLHGIEVDGEGRPIWFRFGMLRLVGTMSELRLQEKDSSTITRRWRTQRFLSLAAKLRDTTWKLDRAAGHVGICRAAAKTWVEREARGDAAGPSAEGVAALEDLPLFLDFVLLYLRMQVDSFATLVPYFYEPQRNIPDRSFRKQQKWFLRERKKEQSLDAEYADILETCDWFDMLAGKNPSGLRDVIVHRGGTYQLGWRVPTEKDTFELKASLKDAKGFAEEDVVAALVEIVSGWFQFLDQCCCHYREKVRPLVTWADVMQDELSRHVHCGGKELPSFWLYPRASVGSDSR